jgi:hypothetical protein
VLTLPVRSIGALAVASANTNGIHANYRVCTWTLRGSDGTSQNLCTRSPVGTGFDSDNGGETVMLTLAEQIGWLAPLHRVRAGSK